MMSTSTIFRGLIAGLIAVPMLLGMPMRAAYARSDCKEPPGPVRSLDPPRYYKDKAGTIVDPILKARHKRLVRPLVTFLRGISSNADKSLRRNKTHRAASAARCALFWIEKWARAGALLGSMGTKQGEYQRKWDMTGIVLSYLKLRQFANASQRAVIEPWLRQLADIASAFFDDPGRRRNNHWYWLGLGLGATGLATESPRHWQAAEAIMRDAARDIGSEGTLKLELARGKLALKYHAFSAMPLVVLAELAASRNDNWYRFGDDALHRLVGLTVSGLQNPFLFERLTGVTQKLPVKPGAGWVQLYAKRFPEQLKGNLPIMKQGHRWLGGDVLELSNMLRNAP